MRWRIVKAVLLVICALNCQFLFRIQVLPFVPAAAAQNVEDCPPLRFVRRPADSEVRLVKLSIAGGLPEADQKQIVRSVKQRAYWDDPDEAASEVLERIRQAWQDRGYFKVKVSGSNRVLSAGPTGRRIAVSAQVEAGLQYRLQEIRFKNNRAINTRTLRQLFPIKDGAIFARATITKGLDNLRSAYGQIGYINFTCVPNLQIDDQHGSISLEIDFDEGKQFVVSGIEIVGLDSRVAADLLLKPGDVYNRRIALLFFKKHAPPSLRRALPDYHIRLQFDEQKATVAVTFDFRNCPS